MKSIKKLFLIILLGCLVAAAVYYFRDTEGPTVSLTPGGGPISAKVPLSLNLTDAGSGLKQIEVTAIQNGNRMSLVSKQAPVGAKEIDIELNLGSLKPKQGPLEIEVTAGDRSIYHIGKGNVSQQSFQFTYDTRPPIISILSKAHNFTKGGSGLVTYRLNEEVEKTGVQVGDKFFRGFLQDSGAYVALIAYPYFMKESEFIPRVVAVDLAGNERQAGIYYRANNKKFRQRTINLSKNFLQQKAPEFEAMVPQPGDELQTFLYVNSQIRKENRAKMLELSKNTAEMPLWQGRFLQMKNASALAQFADYRSYYYEGKKVDNAVHLGYDMASVAQAELEAANDGEVVWAEYLGIYGLCVVIDHGLGLQTLYAHMSQLDVMPGDMVTKGQKIGRSGATGMAGGDHLHFGVFVSGIAVQPLEWWDRSWLKNNIDSKLEEL
ncbi:Peptidase family M23 [Malonomonas rubra DSM 5091]|uniref:Peptidase family M23 n=1 Tax=Malonomonas rubra DSM 5091 TaxID=1122189 RepID=A0A1M6F7P1_MALRU|nr:M23 family metallopeptidase [Malonomonas rubra]SHI93599.1 Peptidase family M23 [Malonomonas rubra DSM 5091]